MMRGIMSDNSLDDITDTIEEITRTVEYQKDELSYCYKLDINLAWRIGKKSSTIYQD